MHDFRLHHIGLVVEDLRAGRQHLVNTLGFRLESEPIEDVGQTARVQFLRLPGAVHWLELVMPLDERSKLCGALRRGVALHHLCYEVEAIEAGLARLRAQGAFPLGPAVPGAAYDGRPIAWAMDRIGGLIELVEAGPGARSLASLEGQAPRILGEAR